MKLRPEQARKWRIALIDGPNMRNLGKRDQGIYGPISSIESLHALVGDFADSLGVALEAISSNHEGAILDFIHESASRTDGYMINPAGLTTYGEATRHALCDTGRPYVEVHFSNLAVHLESISGVNRLESRFTKSAAGLAMGFRQYSYLGGLLMLVLGLDDADFLGPTP